LVYDSKKKTNFTLDELPRSEYEQRGNHVSGEHAREEPRMTQHIVCAGSRKSHRQDTKRSPNTIMALTFTILEK
jgi:hypothetical protein